MKLEGSVILVTGASSGIGRAAAVELAHRGAAVAIAARRRELVDEVAERCREIGARAEGFELDVTDREECIRLAERIERSLGPVDGLVCSAGWGTLGPAVSLDPEDIEGMMRTNYLGAVWCAQAVLPGMLARKRGAIVFVSSILGIMGNAGMSAYAASKHALNGFAESIRDELHGTGVTISLLCPATTETALFDDKDRASIPAASRLVPVMNAGRVGRAAVGLLETGRRRMVLPALAAGFMKLSEIAPGIAHAAMRITSKMLKRRKI
ncbi:MAG: SDR family oxidoreductase [Acidobacteria bacterium]|nr:SDR family oxidoreductase [Acidobacteriota bacterium]